MARFAEIQISVQGRQLRDVARALKEAGEKDLRRQMVRNIRKAGAPALADIKAAALALPASPPHRDLRRQIARATRLRISTTRNAGIRIEVNASRLPAGKKSLPRAMDSRGWRHPVFGNRDRWVFQRSRPWFFVTAMRHAGRFRAAVEDAMEEVKRQIEGA